MLGRLLALALVFAVGSAVAAAPVLAQTSGGFPDYMLEDDGTVVIGGDAATTCPSFAGFLEQGYFGSGNTSAGARRVLERCVDAGLLDPDLAVSAAEGEGGGLPDTGGPALAILRCGSAALLAAGGIVALRVARA